MIYLANQLTGFYLVGILVAKSLTSSYVSCIYILCPGGNDVSEDSTTKLLNLFKIHDKINRITLLMSFMLIFLIGFKQINVGLGCHTFATSTQNGGWGVLKFVRVCGFYYFQTIDQLFIFADKRVGGGHKIDHFVVDDINVWPLMCAYYWILLGFLHQLFTLERHKLSGSFINQSWFYNCFENISSDIDCRRVLISFDFRKVNRMIYLYPTTWLSCHRFNSLLLSAQCSHFTLPENR